MMSGIWLFIGGAALVAVGFDIAGAILVHYGMRAP
jgi:hypothetical protein